MKDVLIWCDQLRVFAIHMPDLSSRTLTESELRDWFGGNTTLHQWADFAMAHANVRCEYDMLPR